MLPARDEAPAPPAPWKSRAAVVVVVGLALAGLVFGAARTLEIVMNLLDGMRELHVSARLAPAEESDAAYAPDAADEPVPDLVADMSVDAEPAVLDRRPIDAGRDAGSPDAGRFVARAVVEAGIDVRVPARPRLHPCDVELAHRVETFYAATASFAATFVQELHVSALGSTTRSHGSLVIERPGKMSWSYDEPAGSRIVSDGQTVSVYEAPNKQLFRVPAINSPYPGAFAFLTGQAPFTALFSFAARSGDYEKVLFYVDRATLQVQRVVILDRQGDHNQIDLVDPSTDVPVDEAQFVFAPPADTIVVGRVGL
jgi:outer membrane lipoprotein carrier protein